MDWKEQISPEQLKQLNEQYWKEGYCCAPVAQMLTSYFLGIQDLQLRRALNAFCGGMSNGGTCGVICGCMATIGLYLGKGKADEERHDALKSLASRLQRDFAEQFGTVNCSELVPPDPSVKRVTCPGFSLWAVARTWDLLQEQGIDLSCRPDGQS